MKRTYSVLSLLLLCITFSGNTQPSAAIADSAAFHVQPLPIRIEAYLQAAESSIDTLSTAIKYGNQALALALESKNRLEEARAKQKLADIYLEHDLYDKALVFSLEALSIHEELKNEEGVLAATSVLGWIYFDAGQTSKALEFHKKLLEAYRKRGSQENLVWVINALGLDHMQIKKYAESQQYFEESLSISRSLQLPERISASLNNIGMVQSAQGNYLAALQSLREAYKISVKLEDVLKQAENLNQMSNTFLQMKQLDSAEHYLSSARTMIDRSTANARKEKLLDNYEFSVKVYLQKKNYEKAFTFLKLYQDTKEEIISLEKNNSLTNALMVHQTRIKEQEIKLLESENKLKILQRDALAVTLLLIGIIGLILYNKQVTSQKKERIIHETRQALIQKELDRASLEKESLEKEILLSDAQKQLAQKNLEHSQLEKEALQTKLDFKNSEFTNAAIHLSQRNELIRSFVEEIKELNQRAPAEVASKLNKLIYHFTQVQGINKDAEAFHLNMETEYKDFIYNLTNRFPDLTENEKRLCSQIRLNLSIKDIASINNISVKSVEMARYRLRKKLAMEHDENLASFLNSL